MVILRPQDPVEQKTAHWAEAFGIFNKEIGRWAASLAHLVPEDSPLRSPIVGRLLGVLGPFIESQSDRITIPILAAFVERFSVFTDEFASCLYGENAPPPKATRLQVSDDWIHDFLHQAHERVSRAEDHEAEFAKVKSEFQTRLKIAQELQDLLKQHQERTSPCRTPEEHDSLRQELVAMGKRIMAAGKKIDAAIGELATPVSHLTNWIRERQERRREEDLCV